VRQASKSAERFMSSRPTNGEDVERLVHPDESRRPLLLVDEAEHAAAAVRALEVAAGA
jgi:hypothetical protein